jgi:hypothetical protein
MQVAHQRARRVLVKIAAGAFVLAMGTPSVQSHEVVSTTVTFDREVVRILAKKCVSCHSTHNIGMPLTSYEETRPWARSIEEEVLRKRMPPWRAVAGYGQFINDIGMTNRETQFIVAWVEGNGPRTKDQQVIADFGENGKTDDRLKPDFDQWRLGTPDLLKHLAVNSIAAGQTDNGGDVVRRVTVDLGLKSDAWMRALEFKPGDRRVVREASFWLQETGQWLGSWTPWYGLTMLPSNTAYRLPGGSHVMADIRYRGSDELVEDRSTLGLYWAPKPPANRAEDLLLEAKGAAPVDGHVAKVSGSVKLPADTSVLAFKPEIPAGLESFEVTARTPDGAVQVLLLVRHVLAEWPTPYILTDALLLPKNTELTLDGYYDQAAAAPKADFKLTVSFSRPALSVTKSAPPSRLR